jgi:hypothetical protein
MLLTRRNAPSRKLPVEGASNAASLLLSQLHKLCQSKPPAALLLLLAAVPAGSALLLLLLLPSAAAAAVDCEASKSSV